jgi:2-oxoglutarate ferredoxin oxidoreductase subunit gamma
MSFVQAEVVLTGIGGQGVQLCAKTLAMAATAEGRLVLLSAHYGGEMRGGQTEASVVVADRDLRSVPILASTWSAFVMHPKYWPGVAERLRPGGVVVANSSVVGELDAPGHSVYAFAAGDIATGLGAPMSAGFVLLGAYCVITGMVQVDSLVGAMRELVPPYRTQHLVANEAALRAGGDAAHGMAASIWAGAYERVVGAKG